VYNAAGERVRKVVEKGNIREERYYFGDYEIYCKFVSGVLETERTTVNISDDKAKIATVDTLTIDQGSLTVNPVAVIRYQYDNHLGSASLELDENANIISYEEYHPFGTTSYRSGRTETEISLKRYKYVGKERDEETGLYYYGFRYYAAWLCRFVSVDPLQFEYPHYTPFQYAGNKPITYIDLDGLEEAKPDSQNGGLNLYCPEVQKFKYDGSWTDYIKAVDNAVISLVNIIPQLWNSSVANVKSVAKGTWPKDVGNELSGMWQGIKNQAQSEYRFATTDPLGYLKASGKTLISPQMIEVGVDVFIPGPGEYATLTNKTVGKLDDFVGIADDFPKKEIKLSVNDNYIVFNKTHKNSLPSPKGRGPNGGILDSHHGLQKQWAIENLSQYGYDPKLAPTITIERGKDLPHTIITNAQNARRNARVANGNGKWSSSLQDELQYIVDDLTKAGFTPNVINDVLEQQYKMLDKLKVPYKK
jgi:RHS repeat-associated protein